MMQICPPPRIQPTQPNHLQQQSIVITKLNIYTAKITFYTIEHGILFKMKINQTSPIHWNQQRVIWIGWKHNNNKNTTDLKSLPKDIIQHIISFLTIPINLKTTTIHLPLMGKY